MYQIISMPPKNPQATTKVNQPTLEFPSPSRHPSRAPGKAYDIPTGEAGIAHLLGRMHGVGRGIKLGHQSVRNLVVVKESISVSLLPADGVDPPAV